MCVALLPIKMNRARLMCVNVIHFLYQMHFPAFSSVSLFLNAKGRNVFMISTLKSSVSHHSTVIFEKDVQCSQTHPLSKPLFLPPQHLSLSMITLRSQEYFQAPDPPTLLVMPLTLRLLWE